MFLLIKRAAGYFGGLNLRGWIAVVCVEILIVVVGVYLAAGLAGLRDQGQQRERQEFILEALVSEIGPFVDQATPVLQGIKDELDAWKVQYETGGRPPPYFIPAPMFLARPHTSLWNAMLGSGGLELMPADFIIEIADFYERTERMVDRFYHIDRFSQDRVLPFLGKGAEYFYPDGDGLDPMYDVYQLELEALIDYALETAELGRKIVSSPFLEQKKRYK